MINATSNAPEKVDEHINIWVQMYLNMRSDYDCDSDMIVYSGPQL